MSEGLKCDKKDEECEKRNIKVRIKSMSFDKRFPNGKSHVKLSRDGVGALTIVSIRYNTTQQGSFTHV